MSDINSNIIQSFLTLSEAKRALAENLTRLGLPSAADEALIDLAQKTSFVGVQSDWQQNDESALNYVKNRPGGYEEISENIWSETTFSGASSILNMTLVLGETYKVTFDSVEYISTAKRDGSYPIFIGNTTYAWQSTITDDPFCIYIRDVNSCYINCDSGDHTVKVDKINIVKIDEKYLDIRNTNLVNGSSQGSLRTIGSAKESTSYEIGIHAFSEGQGTKAFGLSSHAEGMNTTAKGESSHSEGYNTTAEGSHSHAEGFYANALGSNSHAEGFYANALGNYSHAEGYYTVAGQMGFRVLDCRKLTSTTGTYTLTSVAGLSKYQRYSVHLSSSKDNCGKIIDINTLSRQITVDGYPDIALSTSSSSTANYLTIEGKPELGNIKIGGDYSHAEGSDTQASGNYSHSEGKITKSPGNYSHAEGYYTTASGNISHTEGGYTTASGVYSHAEGCSSEASGGYSHAEGFHTKALSDYQHIQGKYNIEDANNVYADIIGNGSSDSKRSNAYTLDWQGNGWFSGDVYIGSTSGTNRDEGSRKLATEIYTNTMSANAIKDSVSGLNVVQISDKNNNLCPVEHDLGVKVSSKNLIPYPYSVVGTTNVGNVSYTINADGTITVKGTSETYFAHCYIYSGEPLATHGTYVFSGSNLENVSIILELCTDNGSTYVFGCNVDASNTSVIINFDNYPEVDTWDMYLEFGMGTVDGTIYPQLELGTTATAYTPYVPDLTAVKVIKSNASGEAVAEYTPTADGTVNGVTSLYPNTTLTTDTDGVYIDCKYNVDLNSTIGDINTALDSIIEIQNSLIGGN